MTDERAPGSPSGATIGALIRLVEDLRTDVREDIGHLRDDVREDNQELERRVMTALSDFSVAHGREHTAEREASSASHKRFDDWIRTAELAQARRDGILGVFRFGLEQISRHSGPLVRICIAIGGLLAVATGAVRLEFIVR